MTPGFEFDAATALNKGKRNYQEDAILSDFARGAECGIVVLADGMGGHAAGDVASKIVVTEVFSDLIFRSGDREDFARSLPACLQSAAMAANACLREHVRSYPETHGMGATLVACVLMGESLFWISIGDSPLFLFRDGELLQLNEDHSMAPQIDFMVKSGLMSAEDGARHPDRNTLTSVLFGDEVPKVDCPQEPVTLENDDILIVASDGLQFLSNEQLEAALRRNMHLSSGEIVDALMHQVTRIDDPDLDNISLSLIKVQAEADARDMDLAQAVPRDIRCVG
jgi:protein phosphatase